MNLLQKAALEFQILPRADRKRFLLANCEKIDLQSCVTVPRHALLYWLSHNYQEALDIQLD